MATSKDSAGLLSPERTRAVVNTHLTPVAQFVRDPDSTSRTLRRRGDPPRGGRGADFVNFTQLAETVSGDAIATNVMMLGYAWQKGLIPATLASLHKAIELKRRGGEGQSRRLLPGGASRARIRRDGPTSSGRRRRRRRLADLSTEDLVERRAAFLTE